MRVATGALSRCRHGSLNAFVTPHPFQNFALATIGYMGLMEIARQAGLV
jgi:hypothetical protein